MANTKKPPQLMKIFYGLAAIGALIFIAVALIGNPARAWQAYLLNFLFFSAIAQGAVLFSALMHTVKARWSMPLANVAESFAAFFPISLALFVILFLGQQYVFPWLHEDLHGKEVWLNVPFLFGRDLAGLILLYGFGLAFLYHRLYFTLKNLSASGPLGRRLQARWDRRPPDEERMAARTTVFGILYLLAFALVLSLVGYDLVMATDPHWFSTLFGAYSFVKAVYVGFGGLIILAAIAGGVYVLFRLRAALRRPQLWVLLLAAGTALLALHRHPAILARDQGLSPLQQGPQKIFDVSFVEVIHLVGELVEGWPLAGETTWSAPQSQRP